LRKLVCPACRNRIINPWFYLRYSNKKYTCPNCNSKLSWASSRLERNWIVWCVVLMLVVAIIGPNIIYRRIESGGLRALSFVILTPSLYAIALFILDSVFPGEITVDIDNKLPQ